MIILENQKKQLLYRQPDGKLWKLFGMYAYAENSGRLPFIDLDVRNGNDRWTSPFLDRILPVLKQISDDEEALAVLLPVMFMLRKPRPYSYLFAEGKRTWQADAARFFRALDPASCMYVLTEETSPGTEGLTLLSSACLPLLGEHVLDFVYVQADDRPFYANQPLLKILSSLKPHGTALMLCSGENLPQGLLLKPPSGMRMLLPGSRSLWLIRMSPDFSRAINNLKEDSRQRSRILAWQERAKTLAGQLASLSKALPATSEAYQPLSDEAAALEREMLELYPLVPSTEIKYLSARLHEALADCVLGRQRQQEAASIAGRLLKEPLA